LLKFAAGLPKNVNVLRRLAARSKWTKAALAHGVCAANAGAARAESKSFSIFKRTAAFTQKSSLICRSRTLQSIIRGRVVPQSVIHSDGWRGYGGLVDVGYDKHFRVNHSSNQFADGNNYINGIESFWSAAKRRLQKFNGVSRKTFYLHLKECEYRFNNRKQNLFRLLLKLLENNPL